ncbi:nucleotide exchange factor GrpE [Alicyclobacillus sp. SO9]|uniref:nucleotide exchange factor GrpE n=1 Tax=Alicyclobacillus sp. SO9 TaxID=2665646 RepID=UPI0018E7A97C|nr:nucleotide exchange factor GrpE [Alicyclobacillus sp. SO9]QQE77347.1 nucleotide exchange factor GrpE [Alicyclobacillus sp. SO9]
MKSKQKKQDAGTEKKTSQPVNGEKSVDSEHDNASTEEQAEVFEAEIVTESDDTDDVSGVNEGAGVENGSDASNETGESSEEKSAQPDEKDAQINDLTQQLLRTKADFDNFRRRTRQEKEDLKQFATKKLLEELLPVVDNFERALDAVAGDSDISELKTGIEMVHKQLVDVLQKHGVEPMNVVDQPFDPKVHEAVMQEPAEGKEPGVVLAELQKGYTVHGQVLRPAMVKVTS